MIQQFQFWVQKGIESKDLNDVCTPLHSSITHKSQNVEATHSQWRNK